MADASSVSSKPGGGSASTSALHTGARRAAAAPAAPCPRGSANPGSMSMPRMARARRKPPAWSSSKTTARWPPVSVTRAVDDDLEHLLQIERRGQRLADGRQRLDLGGALLRRLIVPGGIDGERDLGGDGHGEIELILPPAPLPAVDEGHGADDLVL